MNEIIYINEKAKDLFRKLGVGIIDYITVYRKERDKHFFTAGTGRFHLTTDELKEYMLSES